VESAQPWFEGIKKGLLANTITHVACLPGSPATVKSTKLWSEPCKIVAAYLSSIINGLFAEDSSLAPDLHMDRVQRK
jgi:hypothetical protein